MKKRLVYVLLMCCLCAGCTSVPKTKIGYNRQTGIVTVQNPKDIELKGLKFYITTNLVLITVESYKGKNNLEIVKAVADAKVQITQDISSRVDSVLQKAMEEWK
jgi:hypothetical protein